MPSATVADPTANPPIPGTLGLLLAVLDVAPDLERLLGAEWPPVRDELLELAGRLERGDDATAVGRDLDALLDRLLDASPDVADVVQRVMNDALPPEPVAPAAPRSA